ncbi:GTP-binding protein YdgA [Klebsiella pneumoniae]|nr:GTP-binding protein YdgA [Klebsiella pneumoniae]
MVLGVVWTGGAWFTGKQLEGRIADMVQQANAQLRSSAPESGLELSYQDYQRGLFSSHLQLVVKPIAGQANGWLAAGQSVVLDEVVDHGPFPLASLKAFNLAPAMASVHTTLVKNDASQALFEIAKGDTPFTVDTRIAYSGDSQSAIVLNALDYAKGDEKVTFSGGQFQLDADRDGKNISLKGQAGSGQIDALNEYNQKVQLRFVNLTTDGATELASFNERIGQQKMTLDKLAISVEGKELALIDGMALDGGSTLTQDGKGVNSQVNYTVNSLKLQGQDMGSGKLTLKVDNVDGQAWHQFSQQYSAQSQALLAKPELAQESGAVSAGPHRNAVQCAADPAQRQPVGDHLSAELAQCQRRKHPQPLGSAERSGPGDRSAADPGGQPGSRGAVPGRQSGDPGGYGDGVYD